VSQGGSGYTKDSFVHLHVHSEYSMLDGAARISDLMAGCAEMKMPAVAITDHGNLYGAYEFYKKAKSHGVKPIIGLEAYVTPKTSRFERRRVQWGNGGGDDVSGGGAFTHMTLLSQSTEGMHNLFKLGSKASLEGFFYKPRIDRELLNTYGKGLIATTGCPSGEIQTYLRLGKYADAVASAAELRDIFGAENYFCELMEHGLSIEKRVRDDLLHLAKDLHLPLVATNDLHYVNQEDSIGHEVLLCVQSGSTMADPNRFKFDGDSYYLKSAAEMRSLFADIPEACDNTLLIAERCDVSFEEGEGRYMPAFACSPGENETSWFLKEVETGLAWRYPQGISPAVRARADYETEIIIGKGYAGYMLVVADLINWSKDRGIRTGVRGSGAASMAGFAMGITGLDPLEHGLIFERFLNPERPSMPDIDIDFDERRRGEVMQYVIEKYGADRISQVVTFGTIKAKQAVKDASRVLGYPFGMGDRITKAMPPPVMGKDIPLGSIFDSSHKRYSEAGEFRSLYESDADVAKIVDNARSIEGLKRQAGVHACAVIMSSEPLLELIPISKREQDGAIITQFDYPTCEALGLVKMDFLGLRNLTILDDAVNNIARNAGITLVLEDLPTDDLDTYRLLSAGESLGVFQLDGGPMRSLLRLMKPDSFKDIAALIALYRPGPMGADSHTNYAQRKNGQQEIKYLHPELAEALEPVLGETYGLIVYQEQVVEIARQLAGYTMGSADLLRKAMGKKKKEVLDAEYVNFEKGMQARTFSAASIKALWDTLIPFSDYAFNKAHSAMYGRLAYWTAYLKAHHPTEYMAALLTSVKGDKDKMAIYLAECRRMGITVLPPDVNESEAEFTPVGTDIRFGLTAARNVGVNVVDGIVEARRSKGASTDFRDFLEKAPLAVANKRVVESLIKAGAFDSLGHKRRGLLLDHEHEVDGVVELKRAEENGQDSLFAFAVGDSDDGSVPVAYKEPDVTEWDKPALLANERDMLGLYVSDHPLNGVEHILSAASDASIAELLASEDKPDGANVTIAGLITGLQRKMTKRGDAWAVATVEDLTGAVDVLFFPSAYQLHALQLTEDAVVVVKGRLDRRDDGPQIIASELTTPDLSTGSGGPVSIVLPRQMCTPVLIDRLKEIFGTHPGPSNVHLHLRSTDKTLVMKLEDRWKVAPTPALIGDLKALLGPECVAS